MSVVSLFRRSIQYYCGRAFLRLPASLRLKYIYKKNTGLDLNLSNPLLFNEKLQWLKLYYQRDLLVQLVDKYAVRDYVSEKIGPDTLIPLLAVLDSPDDLDLAQLPDQFILKANHGSGWNIICTDKSTFDLAGARKHLAKWLTWIYNESGHEWPYHRVKPRVVCEVLLQGENGQPPADYKIFCFNGRPELIQVDWDRYTGHKRNLYDTQWNQLPVEYHYPTTEQAIPRPDTLQDMLQAAQTLADDLPFARIDFYTIGQKIYFGEITFYPEAGYGRFTPASYNRILGDKLMLPKPLLRRRL